MITTKTERQLEEVYQRDLARTPEEIAHLLYKFRKNDVNCIDCNAFGICENHADDDYSCEEVLVEWLTKKEV